MTTKKPPHPGPSVWHDYIEPRNLTVGEAAKMLGVSRQRLSCILNGHVGISAEMAVRLELAFGRSAETWCRLQAAYNIARARKKVGKKVGKIKVKRAKRT